MGKTKVSAEVAVGGPDSFKAQHPSNTAGREGFWIITLQTPALICNPAELNESSGDSELFAAYQRSWSELSGDNLELVRYFARQSLAGGFYLHRRFQSEFPYRPFLLTDPGSVFVLRARTGRADRAERCCVRTWSANGLPLPDWAVRHFERNGRPGDHWSNCPYLPENGYGEIAVNLDEHWEKRPKEGEYRVIPQPMAN